MLGRSLFCTSPPPPFPPWGYLDIKKDEVNNETEKSKKLNSSPINEENLQIYFYLIKGLA